MCGEKSIGTLQQHVLTSKVVPAMQSVRGRHCLSSSRDRGTTWYSCAVQVVAGRQTARCEP